MAILEQVGWLLLLSLPVACISWTITHEEIFREPREWIVARSEHSRKWWQRKFWYAWRCEYCLSHYIAAAAVAITDFRLLLVHDWRGYLVAWFSVVAIANVYMSFYSLLRIDIRKEKEQARPT